MDKNSVLPAYGFDEISGIYRRPEYSSIDYSDGDSVEERIHALINATDDRTVLSDEIRNHCTDWPTIYHLSCSRSNVLRPFEEALKNAKVLEIGAGCGAITRYLGESSSSVVAVEGSIRRATIARSRTRDLENVAIVAENFSSFTTEAKFDIVTLIGVLEYANLFVEGPNPALVMLERARSFLKPDGFLVIAIENKLGLKYFAGAPEDHIWKPMYGIENLYQHNQVKTYGRRELEQLICDSGFSKSEFLAPFPDYKLPNSILTETGIAAADFDSTTFAIQNARKDLQLPTDLYFSLDLAWQSVGENGLTMELSNSFIAIAHNSPNPGLFRSKLGFHYSTERKAVFCKKAEFIQTGGSIEVHTSPLVKNKGDIDTGYLIHKIEEIQPYSQGRIYMDLLRTAVTHDGWKIDDVASILSEYVSFILSQTSATEHNLHGDVYVKIPGHLIDLLPQNIVLDPTGKMGAFDQEWELIDEVPIGWILFRTLLVLLQGLLKIGKPLDKFPKTREGFMLAVFGAMGFRVTAKDLCYFSELESKLQSEVSGRPVSLYLNWWAQSPLPIQGHHELINEQVEQISTSKAKIESMALEISKSHQKISKSHQEISQLRQEIRQLGEANDALHTQCSILSQNFQTAQAQLSYAAGIVKTRSTLKGAIRGLIKATFRSLGLHKYRDRRAINRIAHSRLFNPEYYLEKYDDVKASGIEPAAHYFYHGWNELRDPSPKFSTSTYLKNNLDVLSIGINPLIHYLNHGKTEGRASYPTGDSLHFQLSSAKCGDFTPVAPYYPNPFYVSANSLAKKRIGLNLRNPSPVQANAAVTSLKNSGADFHIIISSNNPSGLHEIESQLSGNNLTIQFSRPTSENRLVNFLRLFHSPKMLFDAVGEIDFTNSKDSLPDSTVEDSFHEDPYLLNQFIALTLAECTLVRWNIDLSQEELCSRPPFAGGEPVRAISPSKEIVATSNLPDDYPLTDAFAVDYTYVRHFLQSFELEELDGTNGNADTSEADALLSYFLSSARLSKNASFIISSAESSYSHGPYYESQIGFDPSANTNNIKALAYYLPQFHPIPENDEWHGKGFTEWNKVRSANQLFQDHYQQHVPHEDLGYYLLDSAVQLRRQAEMLKRAGMHGFIFYHYWFTGKLILEKPAQYLLSDTSLDIPFCFCWANENWTRRWDGNDKDVLLAQHYSKQDARDFIQYLIPFFKDSRHLRVDNRPVLFIYRPDAMEMVEDYVSIWKHECAAAGLSAPYIVATLTRGATTPLDYGMDAGVERPLHDWTGGVVPDIRSQLTPYRSLNGSVLDYSEVARFYMNANTQKDFTYFRSLVPQWDNTPRYGEQAYLLHNFNSEVFQNWMECLLDYSIKSLPRDRRFVIVNAWNEWGEGAHLEPDQYIGYGYLNSIGRALTRTPFFPVIESDEQRQNAPVLLRFSKVVEQELLQETAEAEKFIRCLKFSLEGFQVSLDSSQQHLKQLFTTNKVCTFAAIDANPECFIEFHDVVLHTKKSIVDLIQFSQRFPDFLICVNIRNLPELFFESSLSCLSVTEDHKLYISAGKLVGKKIGRKIAPTAMGFVINGSQNFDFLEANGSRPRVNSLIRVHPGADLQHLQHALFSLFSQRHVDITAWIMLQNFDDAMTVRLTDLLQALPWPGDCDWKLHHFSSKTASDDLRSEMLTEGLKLIGKGYATFLDFDDVLFPDAYAHFAGRLKSTRKRATFARVYKTTVDELGIVRQRDREFEYGYSYYDFLQRNCLPLHTVMLDLSQIDLSEIIYHSEMKYMEDYYLLLQILNEEDSDWLSLGNGVYIGDYCHFINRTGNTLAISQMKKDALIKQPQYIFCDEKISQLRLPLIEQHLSRKTSSA